MLTELRKARRLKDRLRNGDTCLGAQIALSDPAIVEIFGRAGFDWLAIDMEHSAQDLLTLRSMLQAAVASDTVVLVRPLRLDADEIRRCLDLGAPGVLCPFINSGEEARRLVQACRYPPDGTRGWGPRRAAGYGFDTAAYAADANASILCIPIIESADAVTHIDEIVDVDGIDGVTIGPMDLSIALGCFRDFADQRYRAAVARVRDACRRHGKAMGTGCYSADYARECAEAGDGLLLVGGDDIYLAAEASRQAQVMRAIVERRAAAGRERPAIDSTTGS